MKLIFNRSVSVILSAVMLFVSALSLNGCGVKDNSQTMEPATTIAETTQAFDEPQQKRKIIIDTDTAGDDASALIIAAKAKNIDILGVTVSAGNVSLDQAVKNALMTLEMATPLFMQALLLHIPARNVKPSAFTARMVWGIKT